MSPKHNRPDVAENLRKTFDCDMPASFETLAPEIVPVTIVNPGENRDVLVKCFGGYAWSAAPTNFGWVQLYNPAASGVDLFLERFDLNMIAYNRMAIMDYQTALSTAANSEHYQDYRRSGTPQGQVRFEDRVSIGNIIASYFPIAAHIFSVHLDVVIPPGTGFSLRGETATTHTVIFYWSERGRV